MSGTVNLGEVLGLDNGFGRFSLHGLIVNGESIQVSDLRTLILSWVAVFDPAAAMMRKAPGVLSRPRRLER